MTTRLARLPADRSAVKSVRYHQGTSNCGTVSAPIEVIEPKQVFMSVE